MLVFGLTACEEEIDVRLNNVVPELVIEGTVTNLNGFQKISLSQTTDYYNPSLPLKVSGASVRVTDDTGIEWLFQETQNGVYVNGTLKGIPGRTYTLEVQINGQLISGSTTMQPVVPIDSVRTEYFPGTRFADPGYFVIINFTDPPGDTPNYYRVKMYNGTKPSPVIMLLDDRLTDGNPMEFFLYGGSYQPGDTAVAELQSLDYPTYLYFTTLSNVLAGEQQGATSTPANPTNNLSDGALGYFGALAVSRDTIVIQNTQ